MYVQADLSFGTCTCHKVLFVTLHLLLVDYSTGEDTSFNPF